MKSSDWIVLDFETSDFNPYACKIDRVCVGLFDIGTGRIKKAEDINFRKSKSLKSLKKWMAVPNPKVAHNAAFEWHLLKRLNVPVKGDVHDTYMMAKHWRNNLPAYDLKSLSWWMLGDLYLPLVKLRAWIRKHNLEGEDDIDFDMTVMPDKLVHEYCMHDIKQTAELAHVLYPKVEMCYPYTMDIDLIPHVVDAERSGMLADRKFYENFVETGEVYINTRMDRARELLDVDKKKKPTGTALRDHLASLGEKRKTKSGLVKADTVVFRDYKDDEAVVCIAELKKRQKEVNTYAVNILKAIDERDIFHPNFHQSAASTRRFKSSNLYNTNGLITKGQVQNFPRGPGIRSGITVPLGYAFQKYDLASIEARLGAYLMSVLLDERWFLEQYIANDSFNIYIHVGSDCENRPLSKKEDIYSAYKHGVLGIQYGVGAETFYVTLHDKFGLPYTQADCTEIRNNIHKKYPMFGKLQQAAKTVVEKQGYIMDPFGDTYYTPQHVIYKAVNDFCQGCAGNILKWWWNGIVNTPEYRESKDYIFNTVHDELDFAMCMDKEVKHRTQTYCDVLKGLDMFELPILAETSDYVANWGEAG
jgi:DNA polymerase-1